MSVTIDVVRIDLDALDGLHVVRLTTPQEHEQAARLRGPRQGCRLLARRAAMRIIVAARFGGEASRVVLGHDPAGRPIVGGGGVHISQSSRGSVMVAALCGDRPVGCDLEELRADIDVDGVARLCFGEGERRVLDTATSEERLRAFYDCWTRKEAFLKATGTGMAIDMASFETTPRSAGPMPRGGVDWTSETWEPLPGFVATVVARGADWTIGHRPFPGISEAALATGGEGGPEGRADARHGAVAQLAAE